MASGKTFAFGVAASAVLLLGAGGALYWSSRGGGRAPDAPVLREVVALGGGGALFIESTGGAGLVRGVRLEGTALRERWRWALPPGYASFAWAWERRGAQAVGELHVATGEGPRKLALIDADRGSAGVVDGVSSGSWAFAGDDAVAVVEGAPTGERVSLYAMRDGRVAALWHAPLRAGRFVAMIGSTARCVVVNNGALQAFDRETGRPLPEVAPSDDVVGLAGERDEVLVLRGGRIVAHALATGVERVTLDLGEGLPVADGLDDPRLLGRAGDRWIVAYATALAQSFSQNDRAWMVPAPLTLAAVDVATGRVAWRRPLGPWTLRTGSMSLHRIDADAGLAPVTVLFGERAAADGGGVDGHLAALRTGDGALAWEATFPGATRSNFAVTYRGSAMYFPVTVDERERAPGRLLVRFEGARLSAAVALPRFEDVWGGAIDEGVWVSGPQWQRLEGDGLPRRAAEAGAAPLADRREQAIARLRLPRAP